MVTLATLEGESENSLLDNLFATNDVLGVMVYGRDTWNKVKNFVANEASKIIAENRGNFGKFATTYNKKNLDAMDRVFGFNHELGAALLGGDNWGHFVNRCKTCAPVLGKSWWSEWSITDILKEAINPSNLIRANAAQLLPASSDIKDIALWITGIQQTKGGIDSALDYAGITAAKDRLAIKKEIQRQQEEEVKRLQEEAQKQRDYENAQAAAAAQLKLAEAQAAAAETKRQIELSPEYQQSKTTNLFILGGLGVLALMVVMGNKRS